MTVVDVKELKRALVAAGLEVFRSRGDEVHLAERQNVSLMEAGVRVRAGGSPGVFATVRAQRSDALSTPAEQLFDLVRERSASLRDAGFREVSAEVREVRSVSDASHVVDTWFEVTFARDAADLATLVDGARAAIAAERYVVP